MLFRNRKRCGLLIVIQFVFVFVNAQPGIPVTKWTAEGSSYYAVEKKEIVKIELPSQNKTVFISRKQLITKNGDTLNPPQLSTFSRWQTGADLYQCPKGMALSYPGGLLVAQSGQWRSETNG